MATPKKRPTALTLLTGNAGKRPLPKNEPKPEVVAPDPPATLSAAGKTIWNEIVTPLAALRVMTVMDVMALEMLCETEVRYRIAVKKIRTASKLVSISPNGFQQQSAWLTVANKAFEQKLKILTEFGMTPSSRTSIQVIKPSKNDPLGKIMARQKRG
jgi:P27 family predicted phage terminase small subunit